MEAMELEKLCLAMGPRHGLMVIIGAGSRIKSKLLRHS